MGSLSKRLEQMKGSVKLCTTAFSCTDPEAPAGSEKAKLPFHGPNRWPQEVPKFKTALQDYLDHVEGAWRR